VQGKAEELSGESVVALQDVGEGVGEAVLQPVILVEDVPNQGPTRQWRLCSLPEVVKCLRGLQSRTGRVAETLRCFDPSTLHQHDRAYRSRRF